MKSINKVKIPKDAVVLFCIAMNNDNSPYTSAKISKRSWRRDFNNLVEYLKGDTNYTGGVLHLMKMNADAYANNNKILAEELIYTETINK